MAPVSIDGTVHNLAVSVHQTPNGDFQYNLTKDVGVQSSETDGRSPKGERYLREGTPDSINLFVWNGAFKADQALADLEARLHHVRIEDRVALRLVNDIRAVGSGKSTLATGRYTRGLIEVALHARKKGWTLDHEIIHALVDYGLIRPSEWRTLARAACRDKERMANINKRYVHMGLSEAELLEEAVADMFADWAAGGRQPGAVVRSIYEHIRDFFEALGRALTGASFRSADDLFAAIDRGEVGARNRAFTLPELSQKLAVAYHGTPHNFEAFSTDKIGTGEGAQAYGWGRC